MNAYITPSLSLALLEALKSHLQGALYLPDDPGYPAAGSAWNLSVRQNPALILLAETPSDIAYAVQFAAQSGLGIAVQATGHGVIQPANDCLLIVTSKMAQVRVDPFARTAFVEAGAVWGDVLAQTQLHGLAPLLGSSATVGAVGYTLGGGLGWLARKYGLAADSVIAFEVVTLQGEHIRLSQSGIPDLFWALRGGGGGFAIVTAMEICLYPVDSVYGGGLFYPPELAGDVLRRYRDWIKNTPEEFSTAIRVMNFPPLEQIPEPLRGRSFAVVLGCHCGPLEQGQALIQEWRSWKTPAVDSFRAMPFREVASISADPVDPMPVYNSGAWLQDLDEAVIGLLIEYGLNHSGSSPLLMVEVRHVAGAKSRPDQTTSAFSYRDAPFLLDIVAFTPSPDHQQMVAAFDQKFQAALHTHLAPGYYMNFLNPPEVAARTHQAFTPETYQRLAALKTQHDPYNLLRSGFPFRPASSC